MSWLCFDPIETNQSLWHEHSEIQISGRHDSAECECRRLCSDGATLAEARPPADLHLLREHLQRCTKQGDAQAASAGCVWENAEALSWLHRAEHDQGESILSNRIASHPFACSIVALTNIAFVCRSSIAGCPRVASCLARDQHRWRTWRCWPIICLQCERIWTGLMPCWKRTIWMMRAKCDLPYIFFSSIT